jgi:hypothetical protein
MILVTKHVARVEEHLEHRRLLQQTDDSARRRVHGEREMHRPRLAYYKFSSRRASIGRRSNFNDALRVIPKRHLILSLSHTHFCMVLSGSCGFNDTLRNSTCSCAPDELCVCVQRAPWMTQLAPPYSRFIDSFFVLLGANHVARCHALMEAV